MTKFLLCTVCFGALYFVPPVFYFCANIHAILITIILSQIFIANKAYPSIHQPTIHTSINQLYTFPSIHPTTHHTSNTSIYSFSTLHTSSSIIHPSNHPSSIHPFIPHSPFFIINHPSILPHSYIHLSILPSTHTSLYIHKYLLRV